VTKHPPWQALLFAALLVAIAMPLFPRIWDLRLLYVHGSVRSHVRQSLTQAVNDRGWLLSDIRLTEITADSATFEHVEHRRHAPPPECFVLELVTSALKPCEK